MFNMMNGMQVIIDDVSTKISKHKQFRFPRSKKKRINKKWSRRSANWRTYKITYSYIVGNKIIMDSKSFEQLKTNTRGMDEIRDNI